jgi:hypothetical protein
VAQFVGTVNSDFDCNKNRREILVLLKCSETRKWRKEFACGKWLSMNEYVA